MSIELNSSDHARNLKLETVQKIIMSALCRITLHDGVINETKLQQKRSRGCGNRRFAISPNYTDNEIRELNFQ